MAAATPARHGRAHHAEGPVRRFVDRVVERRPEAWPTGAAVEFRLRRIKRKVAARAGEGAGAMFLQQRTRERPLGALASQHLISLGAEQFAPLGVSVRDLIALGRFSAVWPGRAAERPRSDTGGACEQSMSACQHVVLPNYASYSGPPCNRHGAER